MDIISIMWPWSSKNGANTDTLESKIDNLAGKQLAIEKKLKAIEAKLETVIQAVCYGQNEDVINKIAEIHDCMIACRETDECPYDDVSGVEQS